MHFKFEQYVSGKESYTCIRVSMCGHTCSQMLLAVVLQLSIDFFVRRKGLAAPFPSFSFLMMTPPAIVRVIAGIRPPPPPPPPKDMYQLSFLPPWAP